MFLLFSYFFAQNIHIFLCFLFISTKHSPKNVPSLFTFLCSKFSFFVFFFSSYRQNRRPRQCFFSFHISLLRIFIYCSCFIFISTKHAFEKKFLIFSYFLTKNVYHLFMFYLNIKKSKCSYSFNFISTKQASYIMFLLFSYLFPIFSCFIFISTTHAPKIKFTPFHISLL